MSTDTDTDDAQLWAVTEIGKVMARYVHRFPYSRLTAAALMRGLLTMAATVAINEALGRDLFVRCCADCYAHALELRREVDEEDGELASPDN